MNYSELRIGNLIYSSNGKIIPVRVINCNGVLNSGYSPTYQVASCNGIPLTEEILIKAGFVIDEDAGIMIENDDKRVIYKNKIHISVLDGVYRLFVDIDEDQWYSFEWAEIKYLHELQNLFFALTKTELNITL